MFGYEKIQLSLSLSWVLFWALILVAGFYSFFVYRITLPPVSRIKKIILSTLRFSALLILIFILFEPILILEKKIKIEPINLVFIDNSRSLKSNDGTSKAANVLDLALKLADSDLKNNLEFFSFGVGVNKIENDKLKDELNFDENVTNFNKIFNPELIKDKNVASITIISDGVITDGSTPIYSAEKFGLPIFTVAIGDSSSRKDLVIKNVIFNEYVYAKTPTTISATILNEGFSGQEVNVSLKEADKLIEEQKIFLNNNGINSVNFSYKPETSGEKKLKVQISQLNGESSFANNSYPFYLNVRSNKIKIIIISGNPGADLTFIKNSLATEDNFSINTLTQIRNSEFLELNPYQKIDSADIFFLLSFPNKETSQELVNKIADKIVNKRKPFFILINNSTDLTRLSKISPELPVILQNTGRDYLLTQPQINLNEIDNPIISNNIDITDWNDMPPILYPSGDIRPKPESKVLVYAKTESNNFKQPLIICRNFSSRRSISFLGKDFWRWKLQTASKKIRLFDNLFINIAKWLSVTDEQKPFNVKTLKKFYSVGDEVEFVAEVYDEAFNPMNDAEVNIKLQSGDLKLSTQLSSIGNGLYEGKIQLSKSGDYEFNAEAIVNGKLYMQSSGKFNIGDLDVEMIDTKMNFELLNTFAQKTNGKLFFPEDYGKLREEIRNRINKSSDEKIVESQIKLWSNEWLMIISILLFSLEWFLRKQNGML